MNGVGKGQSCRAEVGFPLLLLLPGKRFEGLGLPLGCPLIGGPRQYGGT